MHGGNRGKAVRRRLFILIAAGAVGANLAGASAAADDDKPKKPASIWQQETLTGDWGGAREALDKKGVTINLNYLGDVFGVLSGGARRQAIYEHRFDVGAELNLQKLVGWTGATAQFSVLQIANGGHSISDNVGSISDPSDIVALPSTRLFTAWFEQNFNDRVWLRIGQLSADEEFIGSPTAAGLLNGTFGWASLLAADMLNDGPAYPLAVPGIRAKLRASENLTLLAALFSGDPAGANCNDDPQICNRYGTTFSFSGGALAMGEAQYAIDQGKQGLPGIYKLGGWYATADFADQHFGLDAAGAVLSLADAGVVAPLNHRGNWGIYAVADQTVWRAGERSLSLFLRGGLSPSNRNLISYYVDGGVGFKGLVRRRDDDTLTFGVSHASIGGDAAALDRDMLAVNGPLFPIRDYEMVFELSYQIQVAPWWTVQPDLQYIVHPGGNLVDPDNPNVALRNAVIAGVRTAIKF